MNRVLRWLVFSLHSILEQEVVGSFQMVEQSGLCLFRSYSLP